MLFFFVFNQTLLSQVHTDTSIPTGELNTLIEGTLGMSLASPRSRINRVPGSSLPALNTMTPAAAVGSANPAASMLEIPRGRLRVYSNVAPVKHSMPRPVAASSNIGRNYTVSGGGGGASSSISPGGLMPSMLEPLRSESPYIFNSAMKKRYRESVASTTMGLNSSIASHNSGDGSMLLQDTFYRKINRYF